MAHVVGEKGKKQQAILHKVDLMNEYLKQFNK